jgi:hypothetical protein
VELRTVFCVSIQGVGSRGHTANETSYEVFHFRSTLSAITELSDCMFYKAVVNISVTVTPAGDRKSVWSRIQSPANKPKHLIGSRVECV